MRSFKCMFLHGKPTHPQTYTHTHKLDSKTSIVKHGKLQGELNELFQGKQK